MITILSILACIVLGMMIISFIASAYLSYKFIKTVVDEDSKA